MSLLNISNKYIFYYIFSHIPVKRKLAIIQNSKAYYNKLDYFPMIKSTCNKISDLMNNNINQNNSYWTNNKEYKLKKMSYESIGYLISDLEKKFKNDLQDNFKELITELFLDLLISKNIYLTKAKYFSKFNDYKIY